MVGIVEGNECLLEIAGITLVKTGNYVSTDALYENWRH